MPSTYRLKAELEKKNVEYEESMAAFQHRQNADMKLLRDQLAEVETSRQALESEAGTLRDKMSAMRSEVLTEQQDALESVKLKYDRDKTMLEEENSKLAIELEAVSEESILQ